MKNLSAKHQAQLKGGQALSQILFSTLSRAKPGISTIELEKYFDKQLSKKGFAPSFKTVKNYPFSTCINLNEGIVHGLPKKDRVLREGDVLTIDGGLIYRGFHTDMAFTIPIGKVTKKIKNFLKVGRRTLDLAILAAQPGNRFGHISQAIQKHIESAGFNVSQKLTGHSIGKNLHENPLIPGLLTEPIKDTPLLKPGKSLAIEVIYTLGSPEITTDSDNWTVNTTDRKLSALFEKTILITEDGNLEATNYLKNLIK